jgi:putative thiazole-containing bacteriocin maturation protein
MTNLNPSMRIKVKRDTFFVPDRNGGVYFRNNTGSFHMQGEMVDQWIEKLLPMFNGQYTLGDLTDGLPDPYRDRVFEIAEVLYLNGFVRDVSGDGLNQLPDEVLGKYISQIEFLDSFGGSGAHRFQSYRQAKVLAVGSGPFFVSLVAALFESGLPKFHVLITGSAATNRQRLMELMAHARDTDSEVELKEVTLQAEGGSSWQDLVQPFDTILYVSQDGHVDELRSLHAVCREEKKVFLPAIFLPQVGMAGPLVHPDSDACWESAFRRLHQTALDKDPQLHTFSSTAGAMLSNVIVFEWFKWVTGVNQLEQTNEFYLLDLETLEGNWHSFLPHPLVNGCVEAEWVQDFDKELGISSSSSDLSRLLPYFSQLTSAVSGIFDIWDEGNLNQLPLAQCRVQAVDPATEGPADLLPEIICNGLTHHEARRDAGLTGIETYVSRRVSRLVPSLPVHPEIKCKITEPLDDVGVGAGETVAEGVCRGLQQYLHEKLGKKRVNQKAPISQVQLHAVEDERCRFYLQALTTMQGTPTIGLGEEVLGFPVVWVGTNGRWFPSVGLNTTLALRKALQHALLQEQNHNEDHLLTTQAVEVTDKKEPRSLVIPSYEEWNQWEKLLQSAIQVLEGNDRRLLVCDLAMTEPFLKEPLAGVFGVFVREEAPR